MNQNSEGKVDSTQRGPILRLRELSIRCCLTHIPPFMFFFPLLFYISLPKFAEWQDGTAAGSHIFPPVLFFIPPHLPPFFLCSHPYPPPVLGFRLRAQSALFLRFFFSFFTWAPNSVLIASSSPALSAQDATFQYYRHPVINLDITVKPTWWHRCVNYPEMNSRGRP